MDYEALHAHAVPLPHAQVDFQDPVPGTIQRLWHEVKALKNDEMDFGMCSNGDCIYCRGPIMTQRFTLMERLIQIEKHLYGNY